MAYDLLLAERIRDALADEPLVVERKMFGGLAFLIRGHMTVVASSKGGLMIRADPAMAAELVKTTMAEYVVMRGRQMRGWLHLDPQHVGSDHDLMIWIDRAIAQSATLDPKL